MIIDVLRSYISFLCEKTKKHVTFYNVKSQIFKKQNLLFDPLQESILVNII